jgi:predicted DNA-binding transcriptional regulator YafY
MAALRETFGCEFYFRTGEGYFLTSLGTLKILDLDPEELEALVLLFSAIDEGALPQTQQLLRLRDRVLALMPDHSLKRLPNITPSPRLDLPTPTPAALDPVLTRLKPALGRSEISFSYHSPYTASPEVEQHRVAPYELFQRDGYTYLEAYCLDSSLQKIVGRYISYRLDRIAPRSIRRLPKQLPPIRYARRSYRLRYELDQAIVGRRDITLWFEGSTCSYTESGAAVVEACITDLWYARNVLLRYREHCKVIEPPELIDMMRESITKMAATYQ